MFFGGVVAYILNSDAALAGFSVSPRFSTPLPSSHLLPLPHTRQRGSPARPLTMGRYDFTAARVHRAATQLLATNRLQAPPPWYNIVADYPPAQTLVRPLQRVGRKHMKKGTKKPSRMFQPMPLQYEEDKLRQEFFTDHPWELARPRVILEDSGNDSKRWDWKEIEQHNKPLDGER